MRCPEKDGRHGILRSCALTRRFPPRSSGAVRVSRPLAMPPVRGMSSTKRISRGCLKSASAARQRRSMAAVSAAGSGASSGASLRPALRHDERHRHLVAQRIGLADDRDLRDALDLCDDPFELGRADILAADFQHVLGPVGETDQPVLVHSHKVAGDEVAALVERLGGRLRDCRDIPGTGRGPASPRMRSSPVSPGPTGLPSARSTASRYSGAGAADGAVALRQGGVADDALGDDLGHAPPAEQRNPEMVFDRRVEDGVAPVAEPVPLRHRLAAQRLAAERHQRGPGAAVRRLPRARSCWPRSAAAARPPPPAHRLAMVE